MDSQPPNLLVVMTDEHGPMFSGTHGHPLVETPAMDRLAADGVTFGAAYCNSPLCVPSRISFMTGRYVHHVAGWDNSTPLPSDALTWPWLLRSRGYDVALSGKMHLIGPDRLHGFTRQLAVDLHARSYHEMFPWNEGIHPPPRCWEGVDRAGPGTTEEIEADDLAERAALDYLRDPARRAQPFALCVGLIAPHFPLVVPEPYFSRYYPGRTDLPNLPPGHLEHLPPAAQRLRTAFGLQRDHSPEQLRRARAAYYGLVSYVDDKLARLRACLEEQDLARSTVVIHTSDHGEMLGEHGLWRKSTFYEQAARVPLQIAGPGIVSGRRIGQAVSLVDVVATMLDLAGFSKDERESWRLDGQSLLPLLRGDAASGADEVFAEYTAHGTDRARAMLRSGRWKLCYNHGDPPEFELYDLATDPGEFTNLANEPTFQAKRAALFERLLAEWDPVAVTAAVLQSQRERWLIRRAHGAAEPIF